MNCPVICSDTSCFPEIAKNAVSFFDPSSIDSIKSNLEKLIFNDQLLIDLKKRGTDNLNNFSWKKCANETEKIYKNLV